MEANNNKDINVYCVCFASNNKVPHQNTCKLMIIDSGASIHMFNTKAVFESLQPPKKESFAVLGDGKTRLPIQALGPAKIYVNNQLVPLDTAAYVADLEVSLKSILEHACQQGTILHSEGGQHKLTWPNTSIIADAITEITFPATTMPQSYKDALVCTATVTTPLDASQEATGTPPPHIIPPDNESIKGNEPNKETNTTPAKLSEHTIEPEIIETNPTPPPTPKAPPKSSSPTSVMEISLEKSAPPLQPLPTDSSYRVNFPFIKFHKDAVKPSKGASGSVGYNLVSAESVKISPGSRSLVSIGIARDTYGRISP